MYMNKGKSKISGSEIKEKQEFIKCKLVLEKLSKVDKCLKNPTK
jgi:uncharacterized protein YqgQ